jgi:hypothetical protein
MSSLPELSIRGLHNVSESYIDVAKVNPHISVPSLTQPFPNQNLLPSVAHLPSMETLHSIILLSWFEHSHHRLPGNSCLQHLSPRQLILHRQASAPFVEWRLKCLMTLDFKIIQQLRCATVNTSVIAGGQQWQPLCICI